MAKYVIGNIIYENRIRKKITQEELGYGICMPATLSKIENGVQIPRRKTLEALMQRLGLPAQYYFLPISGEELERSNLEYLMIRKLSLGDYDIDELIRQYRECNVELDHMEEQFLMYAQGCVAMKKQKDLHHALELFQQGIQLTIPDFSKKNLHARKLLTFDEIRILNCIASIYYELHAAAEAKDILVYLKRYMEGADIDLEEKAKVYPMILFNLSNWVGLEGRNELAFELCDEGIDFCIQYGKLSMFPYLVFNKAYSLARMNRLDEAIPYFRQACTLFEALKDNERANLCRKEIWNSFSVKL